MKKYILLISLIITLLTSCAPDPRKAAQADQIREQAAQDALNQEQQRQQASDLHAFQVQQLQIEQGTRDATKQTWRDGWNMMIRISFFFATAALCYSIILASRSVTSAIDGISKALVRAAEVRANLIPLDRITRQYPALLQYIGYGRFSLTNPNTNSTLMLDTRNEPDRLMIQAAGATQYAGALAREARQAEDPAGVSIIQSPVVNVEER